MVMKATKALKLHCPLPPKLSGILELDQETMAIKGKVCGPY